MGDPANPAAPLIQLRNNRGIDDFPTSKPSTASLAATFGSHLQHTFPVDDDNPYTNRGPEDLTRTHVASLLSQFTWYTLPHSKEH
jgi:hypothetical protein